ncbi:hypothetical protein [uncultured Thioclava sp.]|jgi:hypothetical protein|uniref:hypothetical protein n=1 Tax=uncultured Thioclava sp. TaxID=473858 RepID=UPI0025EE65C0|nr:hypothetical protein [uncultured Thioclava sp.]
MAKTDLDEFERRLHRIDKIHEAGGAFEAAGSLGRSYFDAMRPKSRRGLPLRGLALLAAGMLLFKGMMLAQVGSDEYANRVDHLAKGNMGEQIGAWVLHADPATRYVAGLLSPLIH